MEIDHFYNLGDSILFVDGLASNMLTKPPLSNFKYMLRSNHIIYTIIGYNNV